MSHPRPRAARADCRGVVLLLTLVAVAILSLVAVRYADRLDRLRQQALSLQAVSDATAQAHGAKAAVLYWVATRPLGPSGHGTSGTWMREDGRWYQVSGADVFFNVQDHRGLLPVNTLQRPELLTLLAQHAILTGRADRLADVLEDYIDTDDFKRLNGAERREYDDIGLPPPRNDWLVSVHELPRLPGWRDEAKALTDLVRQFSPSKFREFNPLTAPVAVLKAKLPMATDEQLKRLVSLRADFQITDGRQASLLTGLPLERDDFIFAPGPAKRIQVWAPGMSRMHEYNVRVTSGGSERPWVVSEFSQLGVRAVGHDSEVFRLPGFGSERPPLGAPRQTGP